jgi:hypothetical protein
LVKVSLSNGASGSVAGTSPAAARFLLAGSASAAASGSQSSTPAGAARKLFDALGGNRDVRGEQTRPANSAAHGVLSASLVDAALAVDGLALV